MQVEPDGQETAAFAWGKDGVKAAPGEVELDARVILTIARNTSIEREALQDVPGDWVSNHWQHLQPVLGGNERIEHQRFELLELPAVDISYAVWGQEQTIALEGRRLLAPPIGVDNIITARARTLRATSIILISLVSAMLLTYLIRGPYFRSAALLALTAAAALLCGAIYCAICNSSLGRKRARVWVGFAAISALAVSAAAVAAEPSSAAAQEYVAKGQLALAERELDALPNTPEHVALRGVMILRHVQTAKSLAEAQVWLAKFSSQSVSAREASGLLDDRVAVAATQACKDEDLPAAVEALKFASPSFAALPRGREIRGTVAHLRAKICFLRQEWTCVDSELKALRAAGHGAVADEMQRQLIASVGDEAIALTKTVRGLMDRGQRLQVVPAAISAWEGWMRRAGQKAPLDLEWLRTTLERDVAAEAREHEKMRIAAAAAEKRRVRAEAMALAAAERQRLREARRQEQSARRTYSDELVCADGSISPSCSCSGSHRGCCSHHGGVAGCR